MKADIKKLMKVFSILEQRELDLKTFRSLLAIKSSEGEGILDLAKKYGVSKSAFSRHVQFLSAEVIKRNQIENANIEKLVEIRDDPHEARKKALFVTPQGEKLILEVIDTLKK